MTADSKQVLIVLVFATHSFPVQLTVMRSSDLSKQTAFLIKAPLPGPPIIGYLKETEFYIMC